MIDSSFRITSDCPLGFNEIVRAISFYDLQEFHLMTDKFHLMPEPTILPLNDAGTQPGFFDLLNERSFSYHGRA